MSLRSCHLTEDGWFCTTANRLFSVKTPLVCCSLACEIGETRVQEVNYDGEHAPSPPPTPVAAPLGAQAELHSGRRFFSCAGCPFVRPGWKCAIYAHCEDKIRRAEALASGCKYQKPKPVVLHHLPRNSFIGNEDMVKAASELVGVLPLEEIEAVVGIARSGLAPASVVAMLAGKPLFAFNKAKGLVDVGCGYRLRSDLNERRYKYLVVDDSIADGQQLAHCLSVLSHEIEPKRLITAAIFANPYTHVKVNFAWAEYPLPHFFEWNLFSCNFTSRIAFDFDGILCNDPPREVWGEGQGYVEWLESAPPKHRPIANEGVVIISARLEKFREPTQRWLEKHRINVRRLELWPGQPADRWVDNQAARWKAEMFLKLKHEHNLLYFCESEPAQARIISSFKIPTICPAAKKIFSLS